MFLDTNVLVAARAANEPGREAALALLARARRTEPLRVSRQVLREYLAVVTCRQTWVSPLPMSDAVQDVRRFASAFEVLEDSQAVTDMLVTLCRDVALAGKQVHDANIVATMLAHGERRLATFNAKDFRRYGQRVQVVGLPSRR